MHGSTSQHSTAHCATRWRRRKTKQTTRKRLGFHWPEAVRVFLRAQAAFLPACTTTAKPRPATMDPCRASLVTYEFKCAVFPRKQAIHARNQSIHISQPELLSIACRSSNSRKAHSSSLFPAIFDCSGSLPSSKEQMFANILAGWDMPSLRRLIHTR